jgi:hypothetical protein
MGARISIGALAALCVAVAALLGAPSALASTGKQSYEGPAATEGVKGRPPAVRLKVQFKKVNHKRGKPISLADFEQRAIALYCPDGTKTYGGDGSALDGGPGVFDQLSLTGQRIRKGKFSFTEESAGHTNTQTITGRVGRKGNATGTIRILGHGPNGQTCDSGVVGWTASPVNAYTPVTLPSCAFEASCPP